MVLIFGQTCPIHFISETKFFFKRPIDLLSILMANYPPSYHHISHSDFYISLLTALLVSILALFQSIHLTTARVVLQKKKLNLTSLSCSHVQNLLKNRNPDSIYPFYFFFSLICHSTSLNFSFFIFK